MADSQPLPPGAPTISDSVWMKALSSPARVMITARPQGLNITKESVVRPQLCRLEGAKTLREFLEEYSQALRRWEAMEIFKSINYKLVPVPGSLDAVEAEVQFVERTEKTAGITLEREDSRTTPQVRLSDNNLFGRAWEATLMAHGPLAAHRQVSLALRSKNPIAGRWTQWTLFNRSRMSETTSLKMQQTRGLSFGAQSFEGPFGDHYVEAGYEVHDVQPAKGERVSAALAPDQGQSERTYLRHEATVPLWRQAPGDLLPCGLQLWIANEVSGIVKTLKQDVKIDWYIPLLPSNAVALSLHARLGLLTALQGKGRIRAPDRYVLGTSYVRGYPSLGPGAPDVFNPPPRPLLPAELPGGNVLGALSASLNVAVPSAPLLHGHCFLNVGNLQYTEDRQELFTREFWSAFAAQSRASVGVGLVCKLFPLSVGRLELNACLPLSPAGAVLWRPDPHFFSRFYFGVHWCTS